LGGVPDQKHIPGAGPEPLRLLFLAPPDVRNPKTQAHTPCLGHPAPRWCRLRRETPRRVRGGAGEGVRELARAEGGTRRKGPGAKAGAGHKRRGNVAERFAARGAVLGSRKIGAQPVAPVLAKRINALHGRARHEGHNALPQRPASSPAEVSSPGRPKEIAGRQYEREELLRGRNMVSMKKSHKL